MILRIRRVRNGRGEVQFSGSRVRNRRDSNKKWILIGIACVVVLAGGFYAWKSGLFAAREKQAPPPPSTAQYEAEIKPENTAPTPVQPPASAPSPGSQGAALAEKESMNSSHSGGTGRYTIYISRQRERARAEEEGNRWKAAGYESFITEGDGWFKLSIGRYKSWEDAKAAAITLEVGFEAGYMVGTLAE